MGTTTKDQEAERLARSYYEMDSGLTHIFRLVGPPEVEADPIEPIKLLEVYEYAIPTGIVPLNFPPHPASGLNCSVEIIQIAPEELEPVRNGELALPENWTIQQLYQRPIDEPSPTS